ncbi:MAG: hypothetical protein HC902_05415, partial [Calothrix sp. SM1_5_4]|nr:hypothetical protein [Calothrix sp. SM1_5_4]
MAKILVKLHGEEIAALTLESGSEYVAGRAQDAQIRLENQRGISRHHLKFYERDGVWVCESLSKFVQIQRGSESMQVLELTEDCVFTVPPFEFRFEMSADAPDTAADGSTASADRESNLPTFFQPRVHSSTAQGGDASAPKANNEATVAGAANLMP